MCISWVDCIPLPLYEKLRVLVFPVPQFLKEVGPLSGRVLDVGGGAGILAEKILQISPGVEYYLILDYSDKKIAAAKTKLAPFGKIGDCRNADIRRLDIQEKFDYVIVCDVLHHLKREEKEPLLMEISKRLKPGGKLIIKDLDNKPRLGYWLNWVHDVLATGSFNLDFPDFGYYQTICLKLGFTNFSTRSLKAMLPYNHRLLTAVKGS